MVYTDAGSYSHAVACIFGPDSDAVHRCFQIFQYTDGTIFCLVACGKGCSCSSRVSHSVGGRKGCCDSCIGELGKQDGRNADFSFQFSAVQLCSLHLIHSHSVSDKVEDVLGLLRVCSDDGESNGGQ